MADYEYVYSVGGGGDFPDLDSALAHVQSIPGWDMVTEGVSGGITIAQNTDLMQVSGGNFSAVEQGDFIKIAGAHETSEGDIYAATRPFQCLNNSTATEARLVSGVARSVTGAAWSLFRPRSVILRLLNQTHVLTAAVDNRDMPNGLKLSLVGDDGAVIYGGGGNGNGQYIRYRESTSISIHNVDIHDVHELVFPSFLFPNAYARDDVPNAVMEFTDIAVNSVQDMSPLDPTGARVIINNLKGYNALFRNPQGDDVLIADCFVRSTTNHVQPFDIGHRYARQTTKAATITNCHFEVTSDTRCLSLGALEGVDNGMKEYRLTNCYVGTASVNGHAALTLRYGKYLVANCVIDGVVDMLGLPSIATFINTRRSDGSLPQFINAENASVTII